MTEAKSPSPRTPIRTGAEYIESLRGRGLRVHGSREGKMQTFQRILDESAFGIGMEIAHAESGPARIALRVKLPNNRTPTTITPTPNIAESRYPKAAPRIYGGA